ncbi:hypothetical protein TNCV_1491911 [Trichonephila clavipes]|nr:hypothetical protein TNCV_1491911 [Trichonephila clavipes]
MVPSDFHAAFPLLFMLRKVYQRVVEAIFAIIVIMQIAAPESLLPARAVIYQASPQSRDGEPLWINVSFFPKKRLMRCRCADKKF